MAEYIKLSNGRRNLKFHQQFVNFKGVQKLAHGKQHFEIYVDKNNQVYDIKICVVKTWKVIEKGKRKFTIYYDNARLIWGVWEYTSEQFPENVHLENGD